MIKDTVDCIQLVSALEYSKEYHPVGLIDASEELYDNQIRGLDFLY